ncbi:MAG: DeoR/GlpR transcriptional regulator [Hyphomicrobiales bacterium]|nr:DeoR/GlpR transcriptional regulator [Hyphomicrobiales bacterium]
MNANSMTKNRRIQFISKVVLERGEVTNEELANSLDVSVMTIHRDLDELERRGVVRKVRNGATAQPSSSFESNIEFRMARAQETKSELCAFAARRVSPGDVLFIDEATTLLPIVPYLAKIGDMTVITNFLPLQRALSSFDEVKLIGLGGEYVPQFDTMSGPICSQAVSQFRATKYLTSSSAIDGETVYHPEVAIAAVKRDMIRAADKSYLLADHSKLNRTALHRVAGIDDFEEIITDRPLSQEFRTRYPDTIGKFTVLSEVSEKG